MFLKFKHVILPFQDPFGDTIVSMSFHAIIYQVVPLLEFMFIEHSELTRNNKWQARILFHSRMDFSSPLFNIYGKECDCRYEANESALICALIYIDVVLGFMIADINNVS